eukprot:4351944-Pleurochrysis_carterae.AAC.2
MARRGGGISRRLPHALATAEHRRRRASAVVQQHLRRAGRSDDGGRRSGGGGGPVGRWLCGGDRAGAPSEGGEVGVRDDAACSKT